MPTRRTFLGTTLAAAASATQWTSAASTNENPMQPIILSTWRHGLPANEAAWPVLADGGSALDAVEAGARQSESDPDNATVGLGGRPDRDGNVTLDACIMGPDGNCGSVACLTEIENPISVARLVMEQTPHVMLVGQGALEFAIERGFPRRDLLTPNSRAEWEKWQADHPDAVGQRQINVENHDTIGLVALDAAGDLAGACTTSGLAWKLPGRVGDSPIIGAGMYADNEVGAAAATGVGEAVIRAVGSFLVVELMRQGHGPTDACRLACERVVAKNQDWRELQVGFIALSKSGEVGGYALQPGFQYAVRSAAGAELVDAASIAK